jgi:hypothetical protein
MNGFYSICRRGNIDEVNEFIKKNKNTVNYNWGLVGACECDHIEIVLLMISLRAVCWEQGLYRACCRGNKELALLMISWGNNNFPPNSEVWNEGLRYAYYTGHEELALLMIEKGAAINIKLDINQVYYLYLKELPKDRFIKHEELYNQCVQIYNLFYKTMNELLCIEDLVKIVVSY